MGDLMQQRRGRQLLSVAWRAWHFSSQLHHLVDHFCGLAARHAGDGQQAGGGAFTLMLCPCAQRALEKGQPVKCSCGGEAISHQVPPAAAPPQDTDPSESDEERQWHR